MYYIYRDTRIPLFIEERYPLTFIMAGSVMGCYFTLEKKIDIVKFFEHSCVAFNLWPAQKLFLLSNDRSRTFIDSQRFKSSSNLRSCMCAQE